MTIPGQESMAEEILADEFEMEETEEDEENQSSEEEANQSQEDEFDIIKYNKQEIKIPVSERQTYLQKGYHYDSVRSERDEILSSIKALGFKSVEEFKQATRERVKQETGRDPFELNVNNHPTVRAAEKKVLESKPYFKDLEAEVDEFISVNPDWSYEQAYIYYRGLRHEELLKKELEMKEKRTVANIHDRGKKHVDTGKTETKPENSLSKSQIALAKEFGVPPSEVAKRVKKE